MPLQIQLFTASVLALTGIAVALVYDIYRAARRAFRWRGLVGEVADLAFWVVCAGLLALGLIAGSWGALRWYGFLMIGAGSAAYFLLAAPLLSPLFRRAWERARQGLRRVVDRLAGLASLLQRVRPGRLPPVAKGQASPRRPWRWPWAKRGET
ncbi:MAG TPA: spore cortex biosynthesis protein YabQ [Bacillota bacterium]